MDAQPWEPTMGPVTTPNPPFVNIGRPNPSALLDIRAPWDPRRELLGQGEYSSPLLRP
jgi:hypothetical protein